MLLLLSVTHPSHVFVITLFHLWTAIEDYIYTYLHIYYIYIIYIYICTVKKISWTTPHVLASLCGTCPLIKNENYKCITYSFFLWLFFLRNLGFLNSSQHRIWFNIFILSPYNLFILFIYIYLNYICDDWISLHNFITLILNINNCSFMFI